MIASAAALALTVVLLLASPKAMTSMLSMLTSASLAVTAQMFAP